MPIPSGVTGSSPRMRGTRTAHGRWLSGLGIIPAYAGNTLARNTMRPIRRDHPRVCGEHGNRRPREVSVWGSSPRMRGTLWGFVASYFAIRDHPRVCGEHTILMSARVSMRGTSPRMRGTPSKFHGMMRIVGDHPRVCGEHRFARFVVDFSQGSSPRMRGTRWRAGHSYDR